MIQQQGWQEQYVFKVSCIKLYYLLEKMSEKRRVKINLTLREIELQGGQKRRVEFEVKRGETVFHSPTKLLYLKQNHALIHQELRIETQVKYFTERQAYQPLDLIITVYQHENQQKTLIGNVRFDPLEGNSKSRQWQLPQVNQIMGFKIIFSTYYQMIGTSSKGSSKLAETQFVKVPYKKPQYEPKKSSIVNKISQPQRPYVQPDTQLAKNLQKEKHLNKTKKMESVKTQPPEIKKYIPQAKKPIVKVNSPKTSPRNAYNDKLSPTNKFNAYNDHSTRVHHEMDNFKKKLQEERAQRVRSISKLKMEISPRLGPPSPPKDDNQISSLKEKIRNFERKQRNYLTNIQQLNTQIQKLKSRQRHLEAMKSDLQQSLAEKDLKQRSAQSTIRALSQQLEAITSRERVVSRKGQAKEGIFKDQVKRFEEKIRMIEEQASHALLQKNQLIQSNIQLQKKYQVALKDRDNKILQEKANFLKMSEQWKKKENALILSQQKLSDQLEDNRRERSRLEELITQLQQAIFKYQSDAADMKASIKLEKEHLINSSEQTAHSLNQQLVSQRRKYNEVYTELTFLREKHKRAESGLAERDARVKDLEESLKTKNIENSKYLVRINQLKKDYDSTLQQVLRRDKEIDALKKGQTLTNAKLVELRDKMENQKNRREQSQREMQKQAVQLNKQRQAFDSQIKDMRWNILQKDDQLRDKEYLIQQLNESILKLNEEIMSKSQRQGTLEQQISFLSMDITHLSKEKQQLQFKIKQIVETLKLRNLELQQQRKGRAQVQQRLDSEKQRVNQYMATLKDRQTIEQVKAREKQSMARRREEDFQRVQIQLLKKQQDINILRGTAEMVTREMQLTKMDSDTIKNELNILEAKHKALKIQHQNLQQKLNSTTAQLASQNEKSAKLVQKMTTLQRQYEQYKDAIKRSMQNLSLQLFKDLQNTNIVATSLIPFPEQQLSNHQLQLVQKRNNYLVKHKQNSVQLQAHITQLQAQLVSLKNTYQQRQTQQNKQSEEQRQRLKALLYEGMMEKNIILQQLALETQKKEAHERQIEKVKAEVSRREEAQLELKGQLSMMLLEYESVNNINQDLSGVIFKHKQQAIISKGEFDQRMLQINQQHANAIQRLTNDKTQINKRLIATQKDQVQTSQKLKKSEEGRRALQLQLQNFKDVNRKLQANLNSASTDVTRLNNQYRDKQKIQQNLKYKIEKLETQAKDIKKKGEADQSQINKLQQQGMQLTVQNEKQKSINRNLQDKLEQLEKMAQQTGQISKQKMQRKINENAQMKSKLIEKESQLQLKQFYLKQKQQQLETLIQQHNHLQQTHLQVKTKLKQVIEDKDRLHLQLTEAAMDLVQVERQQKEKDEMLGKSNFIILSQQNQLEQIPQLQTVIHAKEKECIRLREEKGDVEEYYSQQLKNAKKAQSSLKQQLLQQRQEFNNMLQEVHAKQQKTQTHSSQKLQYLQLQFEKEKGDFDRRVQEIDHHNQQILRDYEDRLERAKEQLQDAKDIQKQISQDNAHKDALILSMRKQMDQLQKDVDDYKVKYNKYYMLSTQNKFQLEKAVKQQQQKARNSLNSYKQDLLQSTQNKITHISRKLEKLRHNQEIALSVESITRKQAKSIIDRIFSSVQSILFELDSRNSFDKNFELVTK